MLERQKFRLQRLYRTAYTHIPPCFTYTVKSKHQQEQIYHKKSFYLEHALHTTSLKRKRILTIKRYRKRISIRLLRGNVLVYAYSTKKMCASLYLANLQARSVEGSGKCISLCYCFVILFKQTSIWEGKKLSFFMDILITFDYHAYT